MRKINYNREIKEYVALKDNFDNNFDIECKLIVKFVKEANREYKRLRRTFSKEMTKRENSYKSRQSDMKFCCNLIENRGDKAYREKDGCIGGTFDLNDDKWLCAFATIACEEMSNIRYTGSYHALNEETREQCLKLIKRWALNRPAQVSMVFEAFTFCVFEEFDKGIKIIDDYDDYLPPTVYTVDKWIKNRFYPEAFVAKSDSKEVWV